MSNEYRKNIFFFYEENKKSIDYKKSISNIPSQYDKYSWNDYIPDYDHSGEKPPKEVVESRKKAKIICSNYANNIEEACKTGSSLILIGKRTSGKTVLATLILKTAIYKLITSYYVNFTRFASEASTANLDSERQDFEDRYIEPPLLCIDELDEFDFDKNNQKVKNYLASILSERQKQQKPTILTSKISMIEIKKIFGNIVYSNMTNENYFLPPIIIDTIYDPEDDFVFIDNNTLFDMDKMIESFKELKFIRQNEKRKNSKISDVIITSEELKNCIVKSLYRKFK